MTYATVAPTVPLPVTNDELTYELTAEQLVDVQIGQLVTVPVRGRAVRGIITGLSRRRPVGVDRLMAVTRTTGIVLPPALLDLARQLREYSWQPLGICLNSMLPPTLKRLTTEMSPLPTRSQSRSVGQRILITDASSTRWIQYDRLLKRSLAAGRSAIVVFATTTELESYLATTALPAEQWRSDSAAGTRWRQWRDLVSTPTPRVVAGVRSAVFAPLTNLGLIIIDQPSGRGHKSDQAPYEHAATIARLRSQIERCHLVIGDTLPPLTDASATPDQQYPHLTLLPADPAQTGSLQAASEAWVAQATEEGALFVFLQRVGAGIRRCQQCGRAVQCPRCKHVPTEQQSALFCGNCGWHGQAPTRCISCHGTTVVLRGVGTETIAQRLAKLSGQPVSILDRNHPVLPKNLPHVIVGTSFALPFLTAIKPTHSLILGVDAARERSTYDTVERTLRDIATVNLATAKQTAIETNQEADPWYQSLLHGDLRSLMLAELHDRTHDLYPPASRLLLIRGSSADALHLLAEPIRQQLGARRLLGPYQRRAERGWQLLLKCDPTHSISPLFTALSRQGLLKDLTIEADPIAEAID